MAQKGSTELGKAFEYACILALYQRFSQNFQGNQEVLLEDTPQLRTAKSNYLNASPLDRANLELAADAAVKVLERLEPKLEHHDGQIPLILTLQTDAAGIAGDVRDVLCIRKVGKWTIGLSCKHNHHAVKHSRLSATINFGEEWFNYTCTEKYFDCVVPIFTDLARIRDNSRADGSPAFWRDIPDKAERYYIPILDAFVDELKRLDNKYDDIPERLVKYLLGRYDFYKVITDDARRFTRIEAINLGGTLGQGAKDKNALAKIPILKMPTQFYHIGFKPGSDNTIIVVCDQGWTISMRLHNASSKVEPSLKFDVQLISLPESIYAETQPWEDRMKYRYPVTDNSSLSMVAEASIHYGETGNQE